MRPIKFALLVGAAMAAMACKDKGPVEAPVVPLAYTRFVNAVADTGAMDYRFVDFIENSPVTLGLQFRGFTPYQATAPGTRHIRVFPTSTTFSVTTQILLDTTITFEADKYYTIIHVGYARAGQTPADGFRVIEDAPASPGGNIAMRSMNLGLGLGNVDLFLSDTSATAPLPTDPAFSNVAFGAITAYAATTPAALAMKATAAGTRTPILANTRAPFGLPADAGQNLTAVGGTTQAGSALFAIFMPRSVAGSSAPQGTAFQSPAVVFIVDKNPPRN
jgi:hypothetical protein